MNNKFKRIVFFLLCCGMLPAFLPAQAWTKGKGKGFYKLDFASIQAKNVYDMSGEIAPFRTLGNYTASFYGEYGITGKLTAVLNMPFFVRNVVNETRGRQTGNTIEPGIVNNHFGDMDLGFRLSIPVKNFAMSANLLFGIPTGDARQTDGLFTGDGEFNQLLKISAGKGKTRWWTQGSLGFNNRTNGFSDEFRYDFEYGYKFFQDRLLVILKINGIESFENGAIEAARAGLFSNNVEFAGIGPELLYYTHSNKKFGLTARFTGALKGQNVLAAPAAALGLFADF